ncbi:MAG TPA: MarR family transcriptional regulator [Egibacteraceae bacterium]|nr:MarR family transcriptional regulator [Egibacteraceae bacterium]
MTSPRWLDEREARAWRGYNRMRVELTARLNRELMASGLSGADYEVLVNLSEVPGERLRVLELGAAMRWEKSRLSHHLTRMAARGLVEREECPTDARGSFVVLTEAGRQAIESAAPAHVESVRRYVVDALTVGQLDALAEISDTVLGRLPAQDNEDQDGPQP